jgi:hypothetical protein
MLTLSYSFPNPPSNWGENKPSTALVVDNLDGKSTNEGVAGLLPALPIMAIQDIKKTRTISPLRKLQLEWNVKGWGSEFTMY